MYRKTETYLTITAPDQTISGHYYIWDNYGVDPSEWTITKFGGDEEGLSTSYMHTYKVKRNDNGAIIKDYLRYDETPPTAPQNLQVNSVGWEPKLTWTRNSEADVQGSTAYSVYRNGSFLSYVAQTSSGVNPSYSDSDISWSGWDWGEVGIEITYKVKANDINNNSSSFSNSVTN